MRRRIVALTVTAAVLAIGLFGIPLAAVVARYLVDDERAELERIADVAALTVSADVARDRVPRELPAVGEGAVLALYDARGTLTLGSGPAVADDAVRSALAGPIVSVNSGPDMIVARPVVDDGTLVGVLRAARPAADAYQRVALVWLVMAALGGVAVGGAWLVSRRQAARLSAPLEAVSRAARRLGDGDFGVRAPRAGLAEIDEVGTSLDATAQRIGALVARERAFSADASHQLRTPVTGLRFGLESVLDADEAELRAAVRTAIVSTSRLERTIDDLITLTRDARAAPGPLDVTGLLADLESEWHARLASMGRPLRVSVPAGLPEVLASEPAARQVVTVLLDNAAVHGQGVVTIAVRDLGVAVAVDVSDEGPGIGSTAGLFDRTVGPEGHGIGLALARSLTEAEGGRLSLTRTAPPTFTLMLPARPGDDGGRPEAPVSPR